MLGLKQWVDLYSRRDTVLEIKTFMSMLEKEEDKDMLKNLLFAYQIFADTEITIPILERVLQLDPKDAQAWAWLGEMYWLNGEDEMSMEKFEIARKINPDLPEVRGLGESLGIRW